MSNEPKGEHKNTPVSYHTFLYPFIIKDNTFTSFKKAVKKDNTFTSFKKAVKKDKRWIPDNITKDDKHLTNSYTNKETDSDTNKAVEKALHDYQAFQYFNPAARKALFGGDESVVSCWRINMDNNTGRYRIQRGNDFDATLLVNAIRLKIFKTGIAVLAFEMEYRSDISLSKGEIHKNIKQINEWGRRLYPEFLAEKEDGFLLCADCLTLTLPGSLLPDGISVIELRKDSITENKNCTYLKDPLKKPGIVKDLLPKGSEFEPAIDDRMFTCCCIPDSDYTEHFLHAQHPDEKNIKNKLMQEHRWRFREEWAIGDELYALINVDPNGACCQNREMLDRYFDEQLYLRWNEIGYSTIQAVTNHSWFCLTGDETYLDKDTNEVKTSNVKVSVIVPFLIEYVQLAILEIAQRASLIAFNDRLTRAIADVRNSKKDPDKALNALTDLAEDFAAFQGQLLLPEVTPQIQGIELYEKLRNMLFIQKLNEDIQGKMSTLYKIASAKQAESEKKQDMILTFIGLLFTFLTIWSALNDCKGYLEKDNFNTAFWVFVPIIAGLLVYVVILLLIRAIRLIMKRRSKSKKRGEDK